MKPSTVALEMSRPPLRRGVGRGKVGTTTPSIRRGLKISTGIQKSDFNLDALFQEAVADEVASVAEAPGATVATLLPGSNVGRSSTSADSPDDGTDLLKALEIEEQCESIGSPQSSSLLPESSLANFPSSRARPKQAAHGVKLLPTLKASPQCPLSNSPGSSTKISQQNSRCDPEAASQFKTRLAQNSCSPLRNPADSADRLHDEIEELRRQQTRQQQQLLQQQQIIAQQQQLLQAQQKQLTASPKLAASTAVDSKSYTSPTEVHDVQIIEEAGPDGRRYRKEIYVTRRVVGGSSGSVSSESLASSSNPSKPENYKHGSTAQKGHSNPSVKKPSKCKPSYDTFILPRKAEEIEKRNFYEHMLQRMQANDRTLKRCCLDGHNLTAEEAREIADAIRNNTFLRVLILEDNPLKQEGVYAIVSGLTVNTSIHTLNLNKTGITTNCLKKLEGVLSSISTLKRLDLEENGFGPSGASSIARMLRKNQSLTHLSIGFNKIEDQGACALAAALKENNSLLRLTFGDDQYRSDVITAIDSHLKKNKQSAAALRKKDPEVRREAARASSKQCQRGVDRYLNEFDIVESTRY